MNDANLVVVARIKMNSLKNLIYGGGYETRAILQISQVIKGEVQSRELDIVIAYGTLPVPKHVISWNFGADGDHDLPYIKPYSYDYSEPISMYEANPDGAILKVLDDVRQDNIWFLRPYKSDLEISTGSSYQEVQWPSGTLGILDFRDVQPMEKEDEFRKMLK